jgi:hypothetical protein
MHGDQHTAAGAACTVQPALCPRVTSRHQAPHDTHMPGAVAGTLTFLVDFFADVFFAVAILVPL